MATPEAKASQEVRLRASDWKSRIYRNNSGVLMNEVGVPVRFGLGNESKKINEQFKTSDFIGWTPVVVTSDMVGKTLAVFTAIEAKPLGFKVKSVYPVKSREFAQNKFIELVRSGGGIGGFASDWQGVDSIMNEFYQRIWNG